MSQWTQEAILKLIASYRSKRLLWDHTSQEYTNRSRRLEAWKEIGSEMGADVMTVERKLKSLKTHFMAVHKTYAKKKFKAGPHASLIKPKWFAYEALTFLTKTQIPRTSTGLLERQQSNPSWKGQNSHANESPRDEFTVFAEHIAIRLKNITDVRSRLIAQHQINNILFEAEIGKFGGTTFITTDPLMDNGENMEDSSMTIDEKMITHLV